MMAAFRFTSSLSEAGRRFVILLPLLSALVFSSILQPTRADAESVDFRHDWRFIKGDVAGAEAAEFDDSAWTSIRLPHDWAISGPFNPRESGATGKLPWR